MGRPYSADLRERVVEAAASSSRRQAAKRFEVGISSAVRWVADVEATGSVAPRPQGRPPGSKLDAHEAFLLGLIEEQDEPEDRAATSRSKRCWRGWRPNTACGPESARCGASSTRAG